MNFIAQRKEDRGPRRRRFVAGLTAVAMLAGSAAVADQLVNTVDTTVDADWEIMPLNAGGTAGTTTLYVLAEPGDGGPNGGCNVNGSNRITVTIASSNSAAATVSPSSIEFHECGVAQTLTVTPGTVGSADITVTGPSTSRNGSVTYTAARFRVNVTAGNTAPQLSISGVAPGASYAEGSVPAATCNVTDTEDGNSSFAATLSAVSGTYATDGIGNQTASCSYTDGAGLTASASATYSIVDPTAPSIAGVLDPSSPDGSSGWYRSDVSLQWTVTENESPNSLQGTGCVDQSITADQAETTYSCSATSAGGSAGAVNFSIKRDATPPLISGSDVSDTTWRNTLRSESFTASDATSGLATATDESFTLTASADSPNASTPTTVSKTVTDVAGNRSTRTLSAKIDTAKPVVTFNTTGGCPTAPVAVNSTVTADWTAADALSGIPGTATGTVTLGTTTVGSGQSVTVPANTVYDAAGNGNGVASCSYHVVYPRDTTTAIGEPINLDGSSVFSQKRTVPVKFGLAGDAGTGYSTGAWTITRSKISCDPAVSGSEDEPVTSTAASTVFRYDSSADQYIFNASLSGTSAGACYRFRVNLADGSPTIDSPVFKAGK